ncbi:PTS lactose/cellobiose transporter subunit IIA [Pontibacillus litoralis]|uniref:PTS mannose transporter subunit IIA n=1 Tax=Pontibacillus litoralis JSM 072002 TaxID=1385512 RepID=A0A0A5HLX3_9BACI|nr:PTS lactose/cellobiose transporter subunit IIA [Pontibacillus litoralis]KGX84627.1 PTS mannose transporter subunit IIA [Pontibacillus litoralis JSM 072002]
MNHSKESEIFEIIAHGGNAKSLAYEALAAAEEQLYEIAETKFAEAKTELTTAHKTQTKLIQEEINGTPIQLSLLMIHAQDHLMTSISEVNLIEKMIKMTKRLNQLENKEEENA